MGGSPSRATTRLVLIEGLPGSGKTSLAEWLCGWLVRRGTTAAWVREEQRDHPVIDRTTMHTARSPGYADRCIERWATFSRNLAQALAPQVFVLEGCLFQSTVRFLLEWEHAPAESRRYLAGTEAALAPLRPRLVYLTQPEPERYLREELERRKGGDIVSRITAYTGTTAFSVRRGLQGADALVALYATYRSVCDALVATSRMPVLQLDAVGSGEAEIRRRASAWVDAGLGRKPSSSGPADVPGAHASHSTQRA